MTFRQKTILGVAGIEAILLLILIWTGIHYLRTTNESELIKRASTTLSILSRATRDAVLSTDIATLQDIANDAIATPELRYVRIRDPDGFVLAEAGAHLPETVKVTQDLNYATVDDGSFDRAVDIAESNTRYGRIEIGLSTAHIEQMISDARHKAGAIAVIEMVLVALFSLALGTYLTRQLSRLSYASRRISEGNLGQQIPVRGNDELACTAMAFNQMSLQVQNDIEKQRAMFESALDCIVVMDHEGRITEFNPAAEKTFGYHREDIIGRPLGDTILPPTQRESYQIWLKRCLNTRENPMLGQRIEATAIHSDGTELPIEMTFSISWLQEKPVFTSFLRDITDRYEYQSTLKEAKKDAEAAARAKSIFLAKMSHEIRTPLNAVLGLIGLLTEEDNLTTQQKTWVKTAQNAGGLLLGLINDILDFSKLDAGRLTLETSSFNLKATIDSTVEILRPRAAAKGIILTSRVAETLPADIKADCGRLRQILVNLIGNAIKFTDEGEVKLEVAAAGGSGNPLLRFSIQDSGIGIPPEDKERLFTEFTQVCRDGALSPDGTGLGLAISRQLVDLMDGQIGVDSKPGAGSCFWFEIPLLEVSSSTDIDILAGTEPASETVSPLTGLVHDLTPISRAQTRRRRILLAEDSPANQMVALAMLKESGHQIDTVANGLEAVESARNLPYDLVLMDISMPEMNGMDATAAIRKLAGDKAKIPIVAMTAHAIKGDQEKFLAAGMDDYISKPVDKQQLLKVLGKWLPDVSGATQARDTDASVSQTSQVLDSDTLEQLARDTSPEMLPRMLEAFRKEAMSRVQAISQHLSPPAVEQLRREAHSLKSSAGTFGAVDLQQLALALELACRHGQLEMAEKAGKSIQDEWNRVGMALEGYLADKSKVRSAAN